MQVPGGFGYAGWDTPQQGGTDSIPTGQGAGRGRVDMLTVFRRIAPEVVELVERRHLILQSIQYLEPIGRRALAAKLDWPERMVRNEVDFLRDAGLIVAEPGGMQISPAGQKVLEGLKEIIRELHGLASLERALAEQLRLKRVIVVPGDSDLDEAVKREIARETAQFLREVLKPGAVLAVTGGSTLAEVARSLPAGQGVTDITVVPARGGLGEDVELQANTVAAAIARRLGARHRLLHVADDLGEGALDLVASDPKIKQVLDMIKAADIVLHGIGTAEEMARRRGLPEEAIQLLHQRGAVGEAFGYYFNARGEIVYTTSSVGLRFEDLDNVGMVVAVGGGHSKAEAALAVMSSRHQDVFITDEGAARLMLDRLGVAGFDRPRAEAAQGTPVSPGATLP